MSSELRQALESLATNGELTEEELEEVKSLLRTASDDEILQEADQGDAAADHIVHSLWTPEKRQAVAARADRKWQRQWVKKPD